MRGSSCGYPHFWCVSMSTSQNLLVYVQSQRCQPRTRNSRALDEASISDPARQTPASSLHAVGAGSRIRLAAVGTAGSADRRAGSTTNPRFCETRYGQPACVKAAATSRMSYRKQRDKVCIHSQPSAARPLDFILKAQARSQVRGEILV